MSRGFGASLQAKFFEGGVDGRSTAWETLEGGEGLSTAATGQRNQGQRAKAGSSKRARRSKDLSGLDLRAEFDNQSEDDEHSLGYFNDEQDGPEEDYQSDASMDTDEENGILKPLPKLLTVNKLNLAHQALEALPPLEVGYKEAYTVWLQDNRLVNVPRALKALENLRVLHIQKNKLGQLPSFLQEFHALQDLNAKENDISFVSPAISQLPSLTSLNLDSNSLESLPPNIGEINFLKVLSVRHNRLQALPVSLGMAEHLEVLRADYNMVSELDIVFKSITRLKTLHLPHNRITVIDPSIGMCTALTSLQLEYNHLVAIPYSLGKLSMLKKLTLNDNPCEQLPSRVVAAGPQRMCEFLNQYLLGGADGTLELTKYGMKSVPLPNASQVAEFALWRKLQVLNVDRNRISSLPIQIAVLERLEVLSAEHNILTTVPPTVGLLSRLTVLALAGNRVQALPNALRGLVRLEELLLESNSLTVLPPVTVHLKSLNELRFDANQVSALPQDLTKLRSLEIVSFSHNHVPDLPPFLTSMHKLKDIRASFNRVVEVDSDFCGLKNSGEDAMTTIFGGENEGGADKLVRVRQKLAGKRPPWRLGIFENKEGKALHGWSLVRFVLFGDEGPTLPFRDKYGNKLKETTSKAELTEEEMDDLLVQEELAKQATIEEEIKRKEKMMQEAQKKERDMQASEQKKGFVGKLRGLVGGLKIAIMGGKDEEERDPEELEEEQAVAVKEKPAAISANTAKLLGTGAPKASKGTVGGGLLDDMEEEDEPPAKTGFMGKLVVGLAKAFGAQVPEEMAVKNADELENDDLGCHLSSLTRLSLDGNQMEKLPRSIGNLSRLLDLDVSQNKLHKLPRSFLHLTSLTCLSCSRNEIGEVPKQLGVMINLTKLDLSSNQLVELPSTMVQMCSSLTFLSLHHNLFSEIPDCLFVEGRRFNNLKTLLINDNPLEEFDPDIAMLGDSLEILHIENTSITEIPESVQYLFKLKELWVNSTKISSVPHCVGKLRQLELLVLSQDALDTDKLKQLRRVILTRKVMFL